MVKKKFNQKELVEFKKIILKRKDEILDEIKHISEDTLKKSQKEASGDISGYTYHMADVATDSYDREFSLGLASNGRRIFYELDDALKKIEDGTFGICEDCKCLIAKNRLKAVPYARLCVKCQDKREKR
jgi:RNA polymerase-binding protein DksA